MADDNPSSDARLMVGDHEKVPQVVFTKMDGESVNVNQQQPNQFIGLSKAELEQFANDPFWRRLRMFLFIMFWVAWILMFAAAIAIVVMHPSCPAKPKRFWYQSQLCYMVNAERFCDSDANGVGDTKGIEKKLGNLKRIGVTTLMVNDLMEYSKDLDKLFGLANFKVVLPAGKGADLKGVQKFIKAVKDEGFRVILTVPAPESKAHRKGFEDFITAWTDDKEQDGAAVDGFMISNDDGTPGGIPSAATEALTQLRNGGVVPNDTLIMVANGVTVDAEFNDLFNYGGQNNLFEETKNNISTKFLTSQIVKTLDEQLAIHNDSFPVFQFSTLTKDEDRLASRFEDATAEQLLMLGMMLPGAFMMSYGDELLLHNAVSDLSSGPVDMLPFMKWNGDSDAGFGFTDNKDMIEKLKANTAKDNWNFDDAIKTTSPLRMMDRLSDLRHSDTFLYGKTLLNRNGTTVDDGVFHMARTTKGFNYLVALNFGGATQGVDFAGQLKLKVPDEVTVVTSTTNMDDYVVRSTVAVSDISLAPEQGIVLKFKDGK